MTRAFVEIVLSHGDDDCDAVGIWIGGLAEPLWVRWIEEDSLRAVDPGPRSLHNVNEPEDLSP